jgi:hypothetical protein
LGLRLAWATSETLTQKMKAKRKQQQQKRIKAIMSFLGSWANFSLICDESNSIIIHKQK